jgi:hypothetical protein
VLFLRNLPSHKQQPRDLDARDESVHDDEIVIGQVGDERLRTYASNIAGAPSSISFCVTAMRSSVA